MIAFLFPGQGAQHAGMLAAIDTLDGGRELLDEAAHILGVDLRASDTAQDYRSTITTQRALFVAGVASARALARAGLQPGAVAGHSVGAYAAATVAGALDFEPALRLVERRAQAMARAFPSGFGMAVIGGLSEREVVALAARAHSVTAPVFASNVNARDQIAIAGAHVALLAVIDAARASGARSAHLLDVAVPSHTPLMDDLACDLAAACERTCMRTARVLYATNMRGELTRDAATVRADLGAGVARPVCWADATRALYERGTRLFIEMHPGTVLSDLATYAFADARAIALQATDVATAAMLGERDGERV